MSWKHLAPWTDDFIRPVAAFFALVFIGCSDIKKSNQILSDTQEEMHAMRLEIAAMREPMQSMSESVASFSQTTSPLIADTQKTLVAVNRLLAAVPPEQIANTLSTVNGFSTQFAKLNETLAGINALAASMSPEKIGQGLDQFAAMASDFRKVNETMAQLSSLLATMSPDRMSATIDNFNAMAEDFKKMNETTAKLAEFVSAFDAQKIAGSLDQFAQASEQFGEALTLLKDTNASIQGFTQISTVSFALLFKMIHAVGFVTDAQAEDYSAMVVDFMQQMVPVAERASQENQANIEKVRQLMILMPDQKMSLGGIQAELEKLNASIAPFQELVGIFRQMKASGEFAALIQAMKDLSSMKGELSSMTGQMRTLNTKFGSIDKISQNFPRITEVSMILGILMTCNTIEIYNATTVIPSNKKALPAMCTDYTYSQRVSRLYTLISEMR